MIYHCMFIAFKFFTQLKEIDKQNKCNVYLLHTHRFFLTNSKTDKISNTNHVLYNSIAIDITGKMSKWLLEKHALKVLRSFLLQNASVSQAQKQSHQWEVILLSVDFSQNQLIGEKLLKWINVLTNYITLQYPCIHYSWASEGQ